MAKDGKKFNKKLALTVAIPALIMVVIMGVVGVSFAWFTDSVTAEIATINLSVAEVFVMEFVLDEQTLTNPETRQNYIYEGQTAYDSNGMLVTDVHANEQRGLTSTSGASYVSYMNDSAFVAPFNLRLDTEGYRVDFGCKITGVNISNPNNQNISAIVLPSDNDTPENVALTEEDIKLGFTWYIKDAQNRLYTPYGTIQNIVPTRNNTTVPALDVANWDVPILNTGFVASHDGSEGYNYTFNIVFAPEVLYWQQYGATSVYNQTAKDVYGDADVDGGYKSQKWNAINKYSSQIYSGSTYKFTVVLTVDSAVKEG
jgi:predicted ribosomally synthesized peptide with SipW-like signal peptide